MMDAARAGQTCTNMISEVDLPIPASGLLAAGALSARDLQDLPLPLFP